METYVLPCTRRVFLRFYNDDIFQNKVWNQSDAEKYMKAIVTKLNDNIKKGGFIFKNKYGQRITTRGIGGELKKLGIKYGLNPKVIYPHSFRHRFAKSFLDRFNDISLLADLMGHESIETTRIYLRRTSTEQQEIVNKIIDW